MIKNELWALCHKITQVQSTAEYHGCLPGCTDKSYRHFNRKTSALANDEAQVLAPAHKPPNWRYSEVKLQKI
jgi:hypothetical protein